MNRVDYEDEDNGVGSAYNLPPFGALIVGLSDITHPADSETDLSESEAAVLDLEEIQLTLAIELEVRDAQRDAPRVTGSTPTQWTATTVMPAFHRLTMRIAREHDG